MKQKLMPLLLALSLTLSLSTPVLARTGDTVGYVYSTDIRAFINGVEVPSCNIGGRTAVIIEDVMQHAYNNDLRTLLIGSLAPNLLRSGNSTASSQIGRVIGTVYETDIRTYLYDTEVPSYNIGGKTAVVLEDIGGAWAFNELGGKYVWDGEARTISLTFLYDNLSEVGALLADKPFTATVNVTNGEVTLQGSRITEKGFLSRVDMEDRSERLLAPLTLDGEAAGWYFRHPGLHFVYQDDGSCKLEIWEEDFCQFDLTRMETAFVQLEVPELTREEIIEYYESCGMATVLQRYDAERYCVVRISQPTPHGSDDRLILIDADGSRHEYLWDIPRPEYCFHTPVPTDLTLWSRGGEEARYLTFTAHFSHYDNAGGGVCAPTDWLIDLETGESAALDARDLAAEGWTALPMPDAQ